MKYGVWIILDTGQCLVHKDFSEQSEEELDQDLISGFQSAILTYADMKIKSIVTEDIRFVYVESKYAPSTSSPRLIFIIAADINVEVKRLEEFLGIVKHEFLASYRNKLDTWTGNLKIFKPFDEKLNKLMREWLVKSVTLDTVLERTKATFRVMIPSSRENKEISDHFGNEGIDVIALIDGLKPLKQIAESLRLDQEKIIRIAEYAIASGFAQEQVAPKQMKPWEEIIEEEYPFRSEFGKDLERNIENDIEIKKDIEEEIKAEVELKTQKKLLDKEGEFDKQSIAAVSEITKEFEDRYGTLESKVERLSDRIAEQIATKNNCSVSFAKVAYQIELDGVLDAQEACEEIMAEYDRRNGVGAPVPSIYSHEFTFAISEGQWVEYLRKKFAKELEQDIRDLANLERSVLDGNEKSVEKMIQLLEERIKIIKEIIYPVISKWLQDHVHTKPIEAATIIASALKRLSRSEAYFLLRNGKTKLFSTLNKVLPILEADRDNSQEVEHTFQDYSSVFEELEKPIDLISKRGLCEIILEIAPRPQITAPTDQGSFLVIHTPYNNGLIGPELTEPADFLERDIKLARWREKEERDNSLRTAITKVYKAIRYQGLSQLHAGALIVSKLNLRFDLPVISTYEACDELTNHLETIDDEGALDTNIIEYVFNYVRKHVK
ncbi:MAG: hypothetical protein ACFFCD_04195 [Promethearchaeota archaeon]